MKTQNTKHQTQNTKHQTPKLLIFVLFLIPVSIFNSCIESDQESIKIESEIKKILDDNNFTLDYIDRYGEKGIKVSNLIEFENLINALNGKVYDPIAIDNILSQNNLEALPYLNLNYNSLSNKFRQNQRINCVDSWRTVYGRIGIGSSATYIDISFQTGTGSGEISNWDAALGGLTFMTSLGKNNFLNTQIASSSNNYSYSGIYSFTIKYVIFLEGIGDVWTSDVRKVRVRVDGCTGVVSYSEINE